MKPHHLTWLKNRFPLFKGEGGGSTLVAPIPLVFGKNLPPVEAILLLGNSFDSQCPIYTLKALEPYFVKK